MAVVFETEERNECWGGECILFFLAGKKRMKLFFFWKIKWWWKESKISRKKKEERRRGPPMGVFINKEILVVVVFFFFFVQLYSFVRFSFCVCVCVLGWCCMAFRIPRMGHARFMLRPSIATDCASLGDPRHLLPFEAFISIRPCSLVIYVRVNRRPTHAHTHTYQS